MHSSPLVSPPYLAQGVSRYDAARACYRCCHCDGLVYMSPSDEAFLAPLLGERERAEAGPATEVGFRQYLHRACGVWLGGRQLAPEHLHLLRHQAVALTGEQAHSMLSLYAQSGDALRQRLWRYAIPDTKVEEIIDAGADVASEAYFRQYYPRVTPVDAQVLGTRNLFTRDELEAVRERVHVSAAQWEQIRRADRNYMALPSLQARYVDTALDYRALWGRATPCQRCEAQVEQMAPGLSYETPQGQLYLHHVCYQVVARHHAERERDTLLQLLTPDEAARLRVIETRQGPVPLERLQQLRATQYSQRHTAALFLDTYESAAL